MVKDPGTTLKSGFFHRRIHYSDDPSKDAKWVKAESVKYRGVNSARWRREMEIDWDVYGGQRVWPMLNSEIHKQKRILDTKNCSFYRVIDHGIRHPTCCLWVAVNKHGDRHFYREYYSSDNTISVNCREIISLTPESEPVINTYIDPACRRRENYLSTNGLGRKEGLVRLVNIYIENGVSCILADNSAAGYDKVTDGLLSTLARRAVSLGFLDPYLDEMNLDQESILMLAEKPAITFDLNCTSRCFHEMENFRYKDQTGDETQKSEPEKVVDVADEGPDCVRYAMQSNLFWQIPVHKIPPHTYRSRILQRKLNRDRKRHRRYV